jgi:WD40 repeat protein/serine/threonine protein kinase
MTPELPQPPDASSPFDDWLIAFDAALASGRTTGPAPPDDPTLSGRLDAARSCLELLEKRWPRHSPATHHPGLAPVTSWARIEDAPPGADGDLPTLVVTPGSSPRPVDPADFIGPDRVGRFHLISELGRGGCGIVHLAFDPMLGRRVALKLPRPEYLLSDELRRRFFREARAAGGLDHPYIVPVFEVGHVGIVTFIASAYCPGPTLAGWLAARGGKVPPRLAARLVAALAEALDYTHRRGVIHRDLKPSNVLLQERAAEDDSTDGATPRPDPTVLSPFPFPAADFPYTPRVTDFGMARLQEGVSGDTHTHAVLGTPAYMAPEQAAGRTAVLGPGTDIYALGAVLYELLTGETPCRGESDRETLQKVQFEDPVPPHRLRPEVPRDLEAVCLRCLQKDSRHRYASAWELADDLGRVLDGRPTRARPVPVWEWLWKLARRHPGPAAAAGVTLVAGLALTAGAAWHVTRLESALAATQEQRDEAKRARDELRRQKDRLQLHLAVADFRNAISSWQNGYSGRAREYLARHWPQKVGDPSRTGGFAWRYAWRLANSARLTLDARAGDAYALAVSPDGGQLATGHADGSVRLWSMADGERGAVLLGHREDINALLYAPDGRTLYSAGKDGTVRRWALDRPGVPGQVWPGHTNEVFCLARTPDGRVLVSGSTDGTVRRWDPASGRGEKVWHGPKGKSIEGVAIWPDGGRLALGTSDGLLQVIDLADRKELWSFGREGQLGRVLSVALSDDGKWLAVGGRDPVAHVWGVQNGAGGLTFAERRSLRGHPQGVESVAFAPAGGETFAVTCGRDGSVRSWNADGVPLHAWRGHDGRLWRVTMSPDGRSVVSAGQDGTVRVWDANKSQEVCQADCLPGVRTEAVLPGPAGRVLMCDKGLRPGVAPVEDPTRVTWWEGGGAGHSAIATGPDGAVALGCHDGSVEIRDAEGRLLISWQAHKNDIGGLAFTPDGQLLITDNHQDGQVALWDAASGILVEVLAAADPERSGRVVAASPDGRWLAAASLTDVLVWKTEEPGAKPVRLPHVGATPSSMAFTPDGRQLLTGCDDRSIKVWDLTSLTTVAVLQGHGSRVRTLAMSPQGQLLASGGDDGTVRLWDLSTYQELISLPGPRGPVTSLAFTGPTGAATALVALAEAPNDIGPPQVFTWQAVPLEAVPAEPPPGLVPLP